MFTSFAGRLAYSKELTVGPQVLRPFHLSWRADFGLSAIIEPDNLLELVEQGLFWFMFYGLRFRTDGGTMQGVEKLAVTTPDSAFLESKYKPLQPMPEARISCAAGVRRPPNCFNMMRQIEVLDRAGVTEDANKVLASAASVARVYSVGPREAAAIVQLTQKVSLLIRRMCSDWDKQGSSRKAWSSKELIPLHVSCGGFLAFMRALKDKIAPGEYAKHEQSLKDQFMVGALDPEILHVLQTTVPPASLEAASFLRPDVDYLAMFVFKAISEDIAQKHRAEIEEKDRELALKVADATLNQVKAKLLADIEVLKSVVPTAETEKKEAGLDLKYLKERQMHAEFARSVVGKKLGSTSANWPVFYFGLLRENQKDVIDFVEESVYTHWDGQPNAPAKTRPREVAQAPDLKLILWQNHRPVFPNALLSKFSSDSDHHSEIKKLKGLVEGLWPAGPSGDSSTTGASLRAVGSPDLTGVDVLDISREVSLSMIPMSDFAEERLAVCPGKGGKPSVLITKTFAIFLGNPTDDEMIVQSCDIMGFYTGTFEIKIIKSTGPLEKHTIPWRLNNDMTLVAYEKKVMPLCVFMCNQARERGIGDFTIGDHEAAEGSDGPTVAPYRYEDMNVKPKKRPASKLSVPSTPKTKVPKTVKSEAAETPEVTPGAGSATPTTVMKAKAETEAKSMPGKAKKAKAKAKSTAKAKCSMKRPAGKQSEPTAEEEKQQVEESNAGEQEEEEEGSQVAASDADSNAAEAGTPLEKKDAKGHAVKAKAKAKAKAAGKGESKPKPKGKAKGKAKASVKGKAKASAKGKAKAKKELDRARALNVPSDTVASQEDAAEKAEEAEAEESAEEEQVKEEDPPIEGGQGADGEDSKNVD
eukprot:s395_g36.t1